MNKFEDKEFNVSEYVRRRQRRTERLMFSLAVVSIVAFIGMVILWK